MHFVNGAGVHAFFSTGIREWCLKDEYDPNCKSAKAIAAWGRLPQPQPCASEWRVWNSGWDSAMVTVSTGDEALECVKEAAADAAAHEADSALCGAVDWSTLSRDLVLHVMHSSRNTRSNAAMACVCTEWREAARERLRRPSVLVRPPCLPPPRAQRV